MKRVQRKRTKGYHLPPNTKYCGRGTSHGNGWIIGEPHQVTKKPMTREDVLRCFEGDLKSLISLNGIDWFEAEYLSELREYDNLACFCQLNVRCHVDIWIEYLEKYPVWELPEAK